MTSELTLGLGDAETLEASGSLWQAFGFLRAELTNWPLVVMQLLAQRYLGLRYTINWRTRHDLRLVIPRGDRSWRTLVETLGADCYRVGDYAPVRFFVDCGANLGGFSLAVLRRYPDARGVALEPSPVAARALRSNLAANDVHASVEVLDCALVGNPCQKKVHLFERAEDTCTSSVVEPDGSIPYRAIDVCAVSLAEVLGGRDGDVDLLKMDVEGAEYEIVLGTPVDALRCVRNVVFEYHPVSGRRPESLVGHFQEAGLHARWHVRSVRPGFGLICAARDS